MTTATRLVVELPLPVGALSANVGVHHMERHRARKRARRDASYATQAAMAQTEGWRFGGTTRVRVELRYELGPRQPWEHHQERKDKLFRPLDEDGAVSAAKAYLDGLADALGLKADSHHWLELGRCQIVRVSGRSQVVFEIDPLEASG